MSSTSSPLSTLVNLRTCFPREGRLGAVDSAVGTPSGAEVVIDVVASQAFAIIPTVTALTRAVTSASSPASGLITGIDLPRDELLGSGFRGNYTGSGVSRLTDFVGWRPSGMETDPIVDNARILTIEGRSDVSHAAGNQGR
jgi:hypothetical protein